jgi:hypothetical protein
MEALHSRRTDDYRIQEAICETEDRDLFPELNIPRSTIRSWIHRGTTDVVSCDSVDNERAELVAEIEKLRRRTALLGTIVGLLNALLVSIEPAGEGQHQNLQRQSVHLPDARPANLGEAGRCTRITPSPKPLEV